MNKQILPVEAAGLPVLYGDGGGRLDALLDEIETEAKSHVPDLSSDKGRKRIASIAHSVAKSKVVLDKIGKDETAELKKKTGLIDTERARVRTFCDRVRDEVRKPLDDWKAEEAAKKEAAAWIIRIEEDHGEGLSMNQVFDQLAELREREEALEKKEAEQKQKEHDEGIRRNAAETERLRLARQEEARKKTEAEEAERIRLAEVARTENVEHRRKINAAAVDSLTENGIDEALSIRFITLVIQGKVPAISINY